MNAHQPGSEPIQIPEQVPNPAVRPRTKPIPERWQDPKEPVEVPDKAPADNVAKRMTASRSFADFRTIRLTLDSRQRQHAADHRGMSNEEYENPRAHCRFTA
jgi:hypothetical protein